MAVASLRRAIALALTTDWLGSYHGVDPSVPSILAPCMVFDGTFNVVPSATITPPPAESVWLPMTISDGLPETPGAVNLEPPIVTSVGSLCVNGAAVAPCGMSMLEVLSMSSPPSAAENTCPLSSVCAGPPAANTRRLDNTFVHQQRRLSQYSQAPGDILRRCSNQQLVGLAGLDLQSRQQMSLLLLQLVMSPFLLHSAALPRPTVVDTSGGEDSAKGPGPWLPEDVMARS
ncbi:hypothetical protein KC320_g10 [Hortaea werneckii]|nr:hypothetical protein KC320_g10 [Hortaea werneckii]